MKTDAEILESGRIWDKPRFMKCGLIKLPDCGTCTVVWGQNEDGWEHVSVAPTHKFRIPSWEDMANLKDVFFTMRKRPTRLCRRKADM